jgi:hypothetical protein
MTDAEAIAILQNGEFGVLSICTDEQSGYGIPLNYVYHDDVIYFHCATDGKKLDYIQLHPEVSFCVVGKTELMPEKFGTKYESAIAFGNACLIEDDEKRKVLQLIVAKYSPGFINEGEKYIDQFYSRVKIIRMDVKTITAKARKF